MNTKILILKDFIFNKKLLLIHIITTHRTRVFVLQITKDMEVKT